MNFNTQGALRYCHFWLLLVHLSWIWAPPETSTNQDKAWPCWAPGPIMIERRRAFARVPWCQARNLSLLCVFTFCFEQDGGAQRKGPYSLLYFIKKTQKEEKWMKRRRRHKYLHKNNGLKKRRPLKKSVKGAWERAPVYLGEAGFWSDNATLLLDR